MTVELIELAERCERASRPMRSRWRSTITRRLDFGPSTARKDDRMLTDVQRTGGGGYYADIKVCLRVYFFDDGVNDLKDQAIEALEEEMLIPDEEGVIESGGIEIIGDPVQC